MESSTCFHVFCMRDILVRTDCIDDLRDGRSGPGLVDAALSGS